MIPVLGVPVLAKPELLYEMIDSIDVQVDAIIIIDNGNVAHPSSYNERERVIRPDRNLGVAASWNRIIAETAGAPWWAIVGYDVVFAPGDLARLAEHMETVGGLALLGGFSAFGVDQGTIERVGWFDENFHPAYFEDNDYDYRCTLSGGPITGLPAGLRHRVSSTIGASAEYRKGNDRTFPLNAAYYERKWGGPPRHERFTTPFDEGGDLRSWQLDENRIAAQSWNKE